jgi:DNA-binding NarL/FixJ family response regulator
MNRITVLLVEDHTIVREGLRALLKMEADLMLAGEAADGREAVREALRLRPDVIVMDLAMPDLNGLEGTRQILAARPCTKILILSAHSDDSYVEQAMALGASGYLVKQSSAHVLSTAIRTVHRGGTYYSPRIARRIKALLKHSGRLSHRSTAPDPIHLTPREREVLQLVAEGKPNKETAGALHISIKTVEKHRQSLMDKLAIHDTAGLTRYAIESGVIESRVQSITFPPETGELPNAR